MLRRPAVALSTAALGALLLTGCVDDAPSVEGAAEPAASLPAQVAQLAGTDVGQFYVTPRADLDQTTRDRTIAQLKQMRGVQKAELEQDGRLNLEFRPGASEKDRRAALKQAAAIGELTEGV